MSSMNEEDTQTNEQIMPFVLGGALLTLFLFTYFAAIWRNAFY